MLDFSVRKTIQNQATKTRRAWLKSSEEDAPEIDFQVMNTWLKLNFKTKQHRKRENLIVGCHNFDDILSKCLSYPRCSDQDSWFDGLVIIGKEMKLWCKTGPIFIIKIVEKWLNHPTFTASKRVVRGWCSWAYGFLKCWRDSLRELTINPCTSIHYVRTKDRSTF